MVQGLSDHLALVGASVSVLTGTPQSEQSEVLPRDRRVKVIHAQTSLGGLRGEFRKCLNRLLTAGKVNIVHDFGLWLPANHAVASECHKSHIPFVSSPSGMLASWALRHKPWKKRLAWWLYQRRDLTRASLLAATSPQELQDIRNKITNSKITLIPNGVEIPKRSANPLAQGTGRTRKVVFLGRIHPVKGLMNLVKAWDLVRPSGWRCILVGPDEAGHRRELETLLQARSLTTQFEFPGLVDGHSKWEVLRLADIFVLPSFTENFGISAAEALASGVPVITTRGTPWKDLVERQCGWWVESKPESLAEALEQATSLRDKDRFEMGQRGRELVIEMYSWNHIANEMIAAYDWLLGNSSKPATIMAGDSP